MKDLLRSTRRFWSPEKLGLLGLAVGLPMAAAGVVSAPRMRLEIQERMLEKAAAQHDRLLELRSWSQSAGPLTPEHYDRLTEELRGLVPGEVDQVELLAHASQVAQAVDFDLSSVDLGEPEDVGIVPLDQPLGESEVWINGVGTRASAIDFLEGLRTFGHPFELRALTLHRASPRDSQFSVELRLGLFTHLPVVEEFDESSLAP